MTSASNGLGLGGVASLCLGYALISKVILKSITVHNNTTDDVITITVVIDLN